MELKWFAEAGCPDKQQVEREIARLLSGSRSDLKEWVQAEAHLQREGSDAWRLDLGTIKGTSHGRRTLRAETCQAIASAASLILALTVDPEAAGPDADNPSLQNAAQRASITNGAVNVVDDQGDSWPGAQDPTGSRRAGDAVRTAITDSTRSHHWAVAPAVAGNWGVLPRASYGLGGAILFANRLFRLETAFTYWPKEEVVVDPPTGAGGDISLWEVGLAGCYGRKPGVIEVGPCLGVSMGRMRATSFHVTRPDGAGGLWATLAGGGRLGADLSDRAALAMRADILVPLSRPEFIIAGLAGPVHRPAPLGGRLSLALEMRF